MANDPYAPCPCGSGKKFKWCCQPIHNEIQKAFQQDADGQHEASLRKMEAVLAAHAGKLGVSGHKAQLRYHNARAEQAEQAVDKALELNPQYALGHYLRGRFRQFEGELAGALLLYRKAAEYCPPEAHSILGE